MARTGHNRSMSPTRVSQPKSEKSKKMKGNEGWWRVKISISVSNPRVYRHFTRIDEGWRVFSWFIFKKTDSIKIAYLWHKCAPRGAHLCSLRNNFTAKENNMTNWAFAVLKNYRKLETTAFVKYLMFNFKSTKAVVLTNWSFVIFSPHALNQRSPARSGIENRWPKGKAKVKGRSS